MNFFFVGTIYDKIICWHFSVEDISFSRWFDFNDLLNYYKPLCPYFQNILLRRRIFIINIIITDSPITMNSESYCYVR